MNSVRIFGAIAVLAVLAGPAAAQGPVCVNQANGGIDGDATATLQGMMARSETAVMQQLAGVWYVESVNAYNGATSQQYLQYTADGSFQYQDRVCNPASGMCNDYSGVGHYAVVSLQDGSISVMTVVSDTGSRDRECTGFAARILDANRVQFSTGAIMQRVEQ